MAKITLVIVLAITCLAAGCKYNPSPRVGLDMDRYEGRWYLLETGPLKEGDSQPLNCIYEAYHPTENPYVFNLAWRGQQNDGTIVTDSGVVTVDKSSSSHLDFFIDRTVFKSMVLATDYTTWAIEYTCHEEIGWERFMLRGRDITLPQIARTTLHNLINGLGVDVADFAVVRHSNCTL